MRSLAGSPACCQVSLEHSRLQRSAAARSGNTCRSMADFKRVILGEAPRKVILTNDDGPDSPFFEAWVKHVRKQLKWNAIVCIPSGGQSFVSKSVTRVPFQVHRTGEADWHVDGSPATCANLAVYNLATDADFLISGPNIGHNAGRGSVLSSGTVGAAMEAAIAGRRSIAISFPFFSGWGNWTEEQIAAAVIASGSVTKQLWEEWSPSADLYNVNVPLQLAGDYRVITTTVDTTAKYSNLYAFNDETEMFEWAPAGLKVFEAETAEAGSDVSAIKERNISVTALKAAFLPA